MQWKHISSAALLSLALLAGCGGGGGTAADKNKPSFSISMRASLTSLPVNVAGYTPNIGGPYTATIYVQGQDSGGTPIPNGENVFNCHIEDGLETGALYYLDGKEDHEEKVTIDGQEVKLPKAFRSVTLGAAAGGASFHFHATNQPGTARIRCVYTDPNNQIQSTSLNITVGGPGTGRPAQLALQGSAQGYLLVNTHTQVSVQVWDERGQPVAAGGPNNVRLRLLSSGLGEAVLPSATTTNAQGRAAATLTAGSLPGTLWLEATVDYADNNVDNGIQDPVRSYLALPVFQVPPGATALSITTNNFPEITRGLPYTSLLEAEGGSPPYLWSLVDSQLPAGLVLSGSGVIHGMTNASAGRYDFIVEVRDRLGSKVRKSFYLALSEGVEITTVNLPSVTRDLAYAAQLEASGGTLPYSWRLVAEQLPAGLTLTSDGVIRGSTNAPAGTYNIVVEVRDQAGLTARRTLSLTLQ